MSYKALARGVLDLDTNEVVLPNTLAWNAYVTWLNAGGALEPADAVIEPQPPTTEELQAIKAEFDACHALSNQLRGMTVIQQLRTRTPAEVDTWIQNNVTDLASAKVVLRILAYVVALLARERLS